MHVYKRNVKCGSRCLTKPGDGTGQGSLQVKSLFPLFFQLLCKFHFPSLSFFPLNNV